MSETGLVQIIEGALLAAGKPMTVAQIAALFEEHEKPENTAIREALQEVAERCDERGFELVEVASGFRFQVRQPLAPWVGRLWQERPQRYSRALLETLALVAYRQPITRGEIEEIRGVAVSTNIIRTLHEREWIRVVGHRDVPGRPAMYATTKQFLDYFNLKSLDQLPALAEIRDFETLTAELGFADLTEGDNANPPEGGPELTVVGGTEHTPSAAEAAEQEALEASSADALENTAAEALEEAPAEGASLDDVVDELEARAPDDLEELTSDRQSEETAAGDPAAGEPAAGAPAAGEPDDDVQQPESQA
ncbi:MAG: SMC-Scp complex subunit ScpB [Halioglobus sp.]|nr:SMC-Scp complex subunit ScpB [Halioglobus sp.]